MNPFPPEPCPPPKTALAASLYASAVLASALGAAVIALSPPYDPCRGPGSDFFPASFRPSARPLFCPPDPSAR